MIDAQKLARDAGAAKSAINGTVSFRPYELERFASLVLEEAAKACEGVLEWQYDAGDYGYITTAHGAKQCAKAVRALKP